MSLESLHGIRQVYKNSTVFLYAMKEQLESKLLKKYIIASNSMNYLGINLKKYICKIYVLKTIKC